VAKRPDAVCPGCGSLERHRLAFLLLSHDLGCDHSTLHVAPEPPIASWLQRCSAEGKYLSIDLAGTAMQRMDLTALSLPDQCMTLIWCSHVLEHIPDDRQAMREMHRVLRPGGAAVIQVPIQRQETYEDFTILTPHDRRIAFGQEDHVRLYGMDVVDRLGGVGFHVEARDVSHLPHKIATRHSAASLGSNIVLLCRRAR
jgi:SAM-dependent methyltransferase